MRTSPPSRAATPEEPATQDAARIVDRALILLERTDAAKRPVRLLGVGVHGLLGMDESLPATLSISL